MGWGQRSGACEEKIWDHFHHYTDPFQMNTTPLHHRYRIEIFTSTEFNVMSNAGQDGETSVGFNYGLKSGSKKKYTEKDHSVSVVKTKAMRRAGVSVLGEGRDGEGMLLSVANNKVQSERLGDDISRQTLMKQAAARGVKFSVTMSNEELAQTINVQSRAESTFSRSVLEAKAKELGVIGIAKTNRKDLSRIINHIYKQGKGEGGRERDGEGEGEGGVGSSTSSNPQGDGTPKKKKNILANSTTTTGKSNPQSASKAELLDTDFSVLQGLAMSLGVNAGVGGVSGGTKADLVDRVFAATANEGNSIRKIDFKW